MPLHVLAADALPGAAASRIAALLSGVLSGRGRASLAVSGGRTPALMLAELAGADLPWARIDVLQVDERVAPTGHADRNLTGLESTLGVVGAVIHPLPVDGVGNRGSRAPVPTSTHRTPRPHGDAAVQATAQLHRVAPLGIDVVHLGLGDDGHTASLIPGDPVLAADGDGVALTGPYRGRQRLTLTYAALARSGAIVWLVAGGDKAAVLPRLLSGDTTIPAGRVRRDRAEVWCDDAAAMDLPGGR